MSRRSEQLRQARREKMAMRWDGNEKPAEGCILSGLASNQQRGVSFKPFRDRRQPNPDI